jgi:TPR repeat protein
MYPLVVHYQHGAGGAPRDAAQAAAWFRKAADNGHVDVTF